MTAKFDNTRIIQHTTARKFRAAVALLCLLPGATARTWSCSSANSPILTVVYDEARDKYVRFDAGAGFGGDRQLPAVEANFAFNAENADFFLNPYGSSSSRRESLQLNEDQFYPISHVRLCPCNWGSRKKDTYCPVDKPICNIPRNLEKQPWCTTQSRARETLSYFWPYVYLCFFLIVVVAVVTTRPGRNAMHYVLSFCVPRQNHRLVARMAAEDQNRANILLRRFHRRTNGELFILPYNFDPTVLIELEQAARARQDSPKPTSLVLKTKIFEGAEAPSDSNAIRLMEEEEQQRKEEDCSRQMKKEEEQESHEHEGDEGEFSCTICFAPIEVGDRVGALPCRHEFHVDCLKTWLQRRNSCPLCQMSNVALPRFDATASEQTSSASDSSEALETSDQGNETD